MKISYLTYQFCRYTLNYCFEMACKYKFDGIEIWGGRPHAYAYDMGDIAIKNINKLKDKYNIPVSMFTPEILAYPYSLSSRLQKEREETLEYLMKSLEVTSKIGSDKMQITLPHPGYNINRKEILESIINSLKILCELAEKLNINIILEPLTPSEGGDLLTSVYDLEYLFDKVQSKALSSMIDIVVPTIENEPIAEYFDVLKNKILYVHISNSDGKTEFHSQLNEGIIPIVDVFSILKSYNYNGWCSIEILSPYFRDPELYLCQSKRIIDNILYSYNKS